MNSLHTGINTGFASSVNGYLTGCEEGVRRLFCQQMELAEILGRIQSRLDTLGMSADRASKLAKKPDAIRNMKRALKEGNRDGISTTTLGALAPVLGVSPEWLISGKPEIPAGDPTITVVAVPRDANLRRKALIAEIDGVSAASARPPPSAAEPPAGSPYPDDPMTDERTAAAFEGVISAAFDARPDIARALVASARKALKIPMPDGAGQYDPETSRAMARGMAMTVLDHDSFRALFEALAATEVERKKAG